MEACSGTQESGLEKRVFGETGGLEKIGRVFLKRPCSADERDRGIAALCPYVGMVGGGSADAA